ncbi:acyl-CoA thioesterase [Thermoclostridium stercorarium]
MRKDGFYKKSGLVIQPDGKRGVKLPLRSLRCNYYHPSYFEDEIVIKTGISYLTPTRIVFSYEVYRKGFLKPIVTGETEHVWVNKDLKPVNMKKYRPELYNLISAIFNEEGCV